MDEPPDGFKKREQEFEAKYLHDEELEFRIHAKRDQLFGVWIAEVLGYKGEKAKRYVDDLINVDLQKSHKDDVLHRALRDLEAAKIDLSEHRVRKKLSEFWNEARQLLMKSEP